MLQSQREDPGSALLLVEKEGAPTSRHRQVTTEVVKSSVVYEKSCLIVCYWLVGSSLRSAGKAHGGRLGGREIMRSTTTMR